MPITFTFISPGDRQAATTDFFALSTDTAGGSGNELVVSAFDLTNTLVGSTSIIETGHGYRLTLDGIGPVHWVVVANTRYDQTQGRIGVDVVEFAEVSTTSTTSTSTTTSTTTTTLPPDADGDGVLDASEREFCRGTPPGHPVTAVGCAVDQVYPCAAHLGWSGWNRHDEYVSCIAEAATELLTEARIDTSTRRRLVRAASKTSCAGVGKHVRFQGLSRWAVTYFPHIVLPFRANFRAGAHRGIA